MKEPPFGVTVTVTKPLEVTVAPTGVVGIDGGANWPQADIHSKDTPSRKPNAEARRTLESEAPRVPSIMKLRRMHTRTRTSGAS